MDVLEKSLTEEKTKNHLITEILQGRDESTQKFQKHGTTAFDQIHEIHQKVVINAKG